MSQINQAQPGVRQTAIKRQVEIDAGVTTPDDVAASPELSLSAATILHIQRTRGNRAAQRAILAHQSGQGCNCGSCVQRRAVAQNTQASAYDQIQRDDDDDQRSSDTPQPDANQPADSQPNTSQPDDSQPNTSTQPDDNQPGDSQPDGNQPDGSQSDDSQPDGSQPDDSQPDGNQPDGSQPDDSQPDGSQPDGNQPDGNQPDGSQPDNSQPDGSQPDGSQPDGTQAEPVGGVAPAVEMVGGGGTWGCDLDDSGSGVRQTPLKATISSSPTVHEDERMADEDVALGMDKPLNASTLTINPTVSSGATIDKPWGGTTPFVGTDPLKWSAHDGFVFLDTPVKVDIRWGTLSEPGALDISGPTDPQLTQTNYRTVLNSLEVDGTGRRVNHNSSAWSSKITTKHELYHVEHLKRLFAKHLPDMQNALTGQIIPTPYFYWNDDDKRKADYYVNKDVAKARDTLRDQTQQDFLTTGENEAYNNCKGDYDALLNGIADYAKSKGW